MMDGRGGTDITGARITTALAMLDAFASVGAASFDVTLTDLAGEKTGYQANRSVEELRRSIRACLEAAARLHGLFALNYSALVSLGLSASALSGMKFALPRLVQGIARQLFMDDKQAILRDYYAYSEEEFVGKWPAG